VRKHFKVLSQYSARKAKAQYENNCQVSGNRSEVSIWYVSLHCKTTG